MTNKVGCIIGCRRQTGWRLGNGAGEGCEHCEIAKAAISILPSIHIGENRETWKFELVSPGKIYLAGLSVSKQLGPLSLG